MGYIRVEPEQLTALASELSAAAQNGLQELSALAVKADPSAIWEGSASQSYQGAFDRYKAAQTSMQEALDEMSRSVNIMATNYDAVDRQGEQAFARFMAG